MGERTFKIARSCYNCKFRQAKYEKLVECGLDGNLYNGRIVCSSYKPTANKKIISHEMVEIQKARELVDAG